MVYPDTWHTLAQRSRRGRAGLGLICALLAGAATGCLEGFDSSLGGPHPEPPDMDPRGSLAGSPASAGAGGGFGNVDDPVGATPTGSGGAPGAGPVSRPPGGSSGGFPADGSQETPMDGGVCDPDADAGCQATATRDE